MQLQQSYEQVPHFHRIPTMSTTNVGRFFYFRDDGVVFVGDNEYDAKEVRATFGTPIKILFEDIQDAFRLGLAVGTLRQMGNHDCDVLLGETNDPTLMKICDHLRFVCVSATDVECAECANTFDSEDKEVRMLMHIFKTDDQVCVCGFAKS